MKILQEDKRQYYRLIEEGDGQIVLEIMLGSVAWYEMRVPLSAEEAQRYQEEGASFVTWLVDRVRDDPEAYKR